MFTAQNSPWSTATRYSGYRPALAVPNRTFNVILYVYYGWIWRFGCGLANKIELHLNRELNDSLSYIILETRTAKVVIKFEVRSFLSRGYFLRCSHLAIPAKLHGPKGDRINESLLYTLFKKRLLGTQRKQQNVGLALLSGICIINLKVWPVCKLKVNVTYVVADLTYI